eukprot:TRINITY_DN3086_c0_g1_i1.p1 TRINITY_DN3086_c0_g1~~TRINITY_DN3086_c0_g1_i1.p1  ORF type:complete len:406 (-),score=59.28 TRINITY_DN3086_c0_g1_i1:41-1258(-)
MTTLIYVALVFLISPIFCVNYYFYLPHERDAYVSLAPKISQAVSSIGMKVQVILYGGNTIDNLRNIFGANKTVKAPLASLQATDWADQTSYNNYQSVVQDGYLTISLSDDDIRSALRSEFVSLMKTLKIDHECTNDADSSCYIVYPLNTNKMSNKSGFWGDKLTRTVYNIIANNEIKNPGSYHFCSGSPRDCGPTQTVAPEYTACWYAAKQLMTDAPTGSGSGWQFSFVLSEFPYFNLTSPITPTTVSSSQTKMNQVFGGIAATLQPSFLNYDMYSADKLTAGQNLRKFDVNTGTYAMMFHTSPIEFISTTNNHLVWSDTFASVDGSTIKSCLFDIVVPPPIVRSVPASFAITGYPPFPAGAAVVNVGTWVGIGIFLFFFVSIGGFMLIRFCCDAAGGNKYVSMT